jgi:biopolymer transport protein ExbD
MEGVAARVVQLRKSSPSLPILLEGDAAVAYGQIVKIMDAVRRAGIENVGLVLEQETPNQTK